MGDASTTAHRSYSKTLIGRRPGLWSWGVNLLIVAILLGLWPLRNLLEQQIDPSVLRIIVLVGINITLATSLNLVNGVTGQFSLGHAGFLAIGEFAGGSLFKYFLSQAPDTGNWGIGPTVQFIIILIIAGIIAAIVGLVVGIPCLRLKGDYLAIATLGFGEIIHDVITQTNHIGPFEIGGASGLHDIPIHTDFFWTYAVALISVVCVWRIVHSVKGRDFLAVREDEIAAAATGVNTTYVKVLAFIIGAFFAGVAGGLTASLQGSLDPVHVDFMLSVTFVAMVVLGGSGSITGVILAAIALTVLPEVLRFLQGPWRMILYSLLLIGMMLLRPEGLLGRRELWWTREVEIANSEL
jgi:branched-chain amino acid transport system permease protein